MQLNIIISVYFILGNDALHQLSRDGACELRFELENFENVTKYAVYRNFSVGDLGSGYRLTIGDYQGTAGKPLSWFVCYRS